MQYFDKCLFSKVDMLIGLKRFLYQIFFKFTEIKVADGVLTRNEYGLTYSGPIYLDYFVYISPTKPSFTKYLKEKSPSELHEQLSFKYSVKSCFIPELLSKE